MKAVCKTLLDWNGIVGSSTWLRLEAHAWLEAWKGTALRTVHIAATAPHGVTVELLTGSVFFHILASDNYSLSLSSTLTLTQSLLFSLTLFVKCSSIKAIIQFILFTLDFEPLILVLDNGFDLNFKMLAHCTHHSLSQINYFSE